MPEARERLAGGETTGLNRVEGEVALKGREKASCTPAGVPPPLGARYPVVSLRDFVAPPAPFFRASGSELEQLVQITKLSARKQRLAKGRERDAFEAVFG